MRFHIAYKKYFFVVLKVFIYYLTDNKENKKIIIRIIFGENIRLYLIRFFIL